MSAGSVAAGRAGWRLLRWYLPRALFVVAVVVISVALYIRIARGNQPPEPLAVVMLAVYLLWLVAEARITFAKQHEAAAEERTLAPYAAARVGTAAAAALGPLPWTGWSPWLVAALIAFGGGIGLRLWAIAVLGRFYSHHVVRYPDQVVVTSGPYRLVRHPAYAGMLLSHAGFVGFFLNPVSVVMLMGLVAAVVWRIRVEERVLSTLRGYREYAAGRARLLPGMW